MIAIGDSPPPAKKLKASSYFSKPSSSTISKAASSGPSRSPSIARPPRTASKALEAYRLPPTTSSGPSQSGSAFDILVLPGLGEPVSRPSVQRTPAQQALHEEWQRRLLERPGGLIPRRRSLALDEAAAAEARAQLGVDGDEGPDTPLEEDGKANSDEERTRHAEEIGSKLAAKYGAKTNGKGNPVTKTRKKKEEEIGPSGQTYTPLERQYMEVKAKNPDVLLLMEGGSDFELG